MFASLIEDVRFFVEGRSKPQQRAGRARMAAKATERGARFSQDDTDRAWRAGGNAQAAVQRLAMAGKKLTMRDLGKATTVASQTALDRAISNKKRRVEDRAQESSGPPGQKRHRQMATLKRTDPQAHHDVLYARTPGSAKKALRKRRTWAGVTGDRLKQRALQWPQRQRGFKGKYGAAGNLSRKAFDKRLSQLKDKNKG